MILGELVPGAQGELPSRSGISIWSYESHWMAKLPGRHEPGSMMVQA